jgi:hypothetical protein
MSCENENFENLCFDPFDIYNDSVINSDCDADLHFFNDIKIFSEYYDIEN